MPQLNKQNLEDYIYSNCKRQFSLDMATKEERKQKKLPSGFEEKSKNKVSQEGEKWESELYEVIRSKFSRNLIYESVKNHKNDFVDLKYILNNDPKSGSFIFQGQLNIHSDSLIQNSNINHSLDISKIKPDIIMVLDPLDDYLPNTEIGYILPNGIIVPYERGDTRKRLRIIDVKLSPEAKSKHFTEIAFYCLLLSIFLKENKLDDKFVVSSDSCVLAKNRNGLFIERLSNEFDAEKKYKAFNKDLKSTNLKLFLDQILWIIKNDLKTILNGNWDDLEWTITSQCLGCKYLGKTGKETEVLKDKTVIPKFSCKRENIQILSIDMIYGLTPGEKRLLKQNNVFSIEDFLKISDKEFENNYASHPKFLLKKTILLERAKALLEFYMKNAEKSWFLINQETRTSVLKLNDLSFYITGSFDNSSGEPLLLSVNYQLSSQLRDLIPEDKKDDYLKQENLFLFEKNTDDYIYKKFIDFMKSIHNVFYKKNMDTYKDRYQDPMFSFYFWDKSTYENIVNLLEKYSDRIIYSHPFLKKIFWIFSSVELPNINKDHEYNHIIFIKDIVDKYLIAPIPYYYSLIEVAKIFNLEYKNSPYFESEIYSRYINPMSDSVPIEIAYELWVSDENKADQNSRNQLIKMLDKLNQKSNFNLRQIVIRIRNEFKNNFSNEKSVFTQKTDYEDLMHPDINYLLSFHAAHSILEKQTIKDLKKLSVEEKIIKQKTALTNGMIRDDILENFLKAHNFNLEENMFAFKLSNSSINFTGKEKESNWALVPRIYSGKSLDYVGKLLDLSDDKYTIYDKNKTVEDIFSATIELIDRDLGCIIVSFKDLNKINSTLKKILDDNLINLDDIFILENTSIDVLNKKIEKIFTKMGYSEKSTYNPILDINPNINLNNFKEETGFHKFLWDPQSLANDKINTNVEKFISIIENKKYVINQSQKEAIIKSLTSHLHLIWGPPGTGKSFTLVMIILVALLDAKLSNRKLRILISSFTWTAIDNILKEFKEVIPDFLDNDYMLVRIRSSMGKQSNYGSLTENDVVLRRRSPSSEVKILKSALLNRSPYNPTENGLFIVGTTVHQLSNLLLMNEKENIEGLFDLIILDEASQIPVSHALACMASLHKDGSIIIAGDHLQLAPVQSFKPKNINKKYLVGSVYNFLYDFHKIEQSQLNINYRSNQSIVDFCKLSGYQPDLKSFNPLQVLQFKNNHYLSSQYKDFLEPENSLITYLHDDKISNQSSEFEADLVVNLVAEFYENLKYNSDQYKTEFWEKLLGIITPHRAQQSLIIGKLIKRFPDHDKVLIRNCVDTVERFQGQQRDIIISSFALGDEDAISSEEEFLYSLHRFNVMVSRARMKMILLISENMVNYIPNELEVIKNSNLLKTYVNNICNYTSGHNLDTDKIKGKIKFHKNAEIITSYQFQNNDLIEFGKTTKKTKNKINKTTEISKLSNLTLEDLDF